MGAYPQSTVRRQDLIKSSGLQPFGAFVKDGMIIPGWSASLASTIPTTNLTAMYWSKVGDSVLAAGSDGRIYAGTTGLSLKQIFADGGNSPFVFETYNTTPRGMLISGNRHVTVRDNMWASGTFSVELACGTTRRGRLYGGDAAMPYTLRWSGPKDYKDWTEGISGAGSLILEPTGGYIIDLFDFEDKLVVFRESSIMRFSVYGDPESFKEIDALRVPDVARNTMAIAGDGILFFVSDGLMRYRGGKATRIEGLITDDLASPVSAFVCSNRYYFICGSSKSLGRSVVYVYDVLCDCYQIIDIPAYFISLDKQTVLAYTDSEIYRLRSNYEKIQYGVISGNIDFGTDKRKLATLLEVDCDEDVTVKISDGEHVRTIDCPNGRTRLNMRGNRFTVTFCGSTGCVRSAYLSAEVT